jgi:hypothetical protein
LAIHDTLIFFTFEFFFKLVFFLAIVLFFKLCFVDILFL